MLLLKLLICWALFVLVVYVVMLIDVLYYKRSVALFFGRWFRAITAEE